MRVPRSVNVARPLRGSTGTTPSSRAAYGSGSGWHRVALASGPARISAGGVDKNMVPGEDA
jgi:hypothetical protein